MSRGAPGARLPEAIGWTRRPATPASPGADRGISRRLWLFLCVVFLTSSVISVTGMIVLIGWITTL